MSENLSGKTIAFLATDGFEQSELTHPWKAVEAAGGTPKLISLKTGKIQGMKHLDKGDSFTVDTAVSSANAADYDLLVLPGGLANPDALRTSDDALQFVRDTAKQGTPIAAICHGPWVLADAGLLSNRTVTSFPSIKRDLENAGAKWIDTEVHVDDGLVTSRSPDDLEAFSAKVIEEAAEGRHESQARDAKQALAH